MIYILLLLAIVAPFAATYLATQRLFRRLHSFHRWQAEQAAALHHLANSATSFGHSIAEGLRRFGSAFPTSVTLLHQHQTVIAATPDNSADESVPEDVVAYLRGWNEPWAREEELRYLRGLKARLGSWDAALQSVIVADQPFHDAQ